MLALALANSNLATINALEAITKLLLRHEEEIKNLKNQILKGGTHEC